MTSSVGLAIQCVAIFLVALLSHSMRGSIKSASLKCWTRAWVSLSIALLSLFLGFHLVSGYKLFYSVYFFGEYAFGLMFIGGCRYLASGVSMTHRCYSMLIPAALLAIALPWLSADFNDLFMVQATVMAGLFAASFVSLWPALRQRETSPGLRIMSGCVDPVDDQFPALPACLRSAQRSLGNNCAGRIFAVHVDL